MLVLVLVPVLVLELIGASGVEFIIFRTLGAPGVGFIMFYMLVCIGLRFFIVVCFCCTFPKQYMYRFTLPLFPEAVHVLIHAALASRSSAHRVLKVP
jgi:hypothetical protein